MSQDGEKSVVDTLVAKYRQLHSAEKKAADCILADPYAVMELSVAQLADRCGVSDATIVRMCQHIGYKGYYQMRILMSKDLGRKQSLDVASVAKDPVGYAFEQDVAYLRSLASNENKTAIIDAARAINNANTVIVSAAGNTNPVALDLAFRLNRFHVRAFSSLVEEECVNYVSNSGVGDLLIAVSKSGMTVRTLQIAEYAKKNGLKLVAITGDECSTLAQRADYVVFSGSNNTMLSTIQHGLETHLGEHLVVDALLIVLNGLIAETGSKEDAELEVSSWKI